MILLHQGHRIENRDQPEVQLHVGTFEDYVLMHVPLCISIVAILHICHWYAILVSSPSSFYRRLFSYIYKSEVPQELTRMASIWCIDGVFLDMRIEKKGTSFHESCTGWSCASLFCVKGEPLGGRGLILYQNGLWLKLEYINFMR